MWLSPAEFSRVWALRPDVFSIMLRIAEDYERATGGRRLFVESDGGVRSFARQAELRADSLDASGRTKPGYRAAPAGGSPHEVGAAFHLKPVDWQDRTAAQLHQDAELLAQLAENRGLVAGQHFRSGNPDPWHFETKESQAERRVKWDTLTRERLWRALGLLVSIVGLWFTWRTYRRRTKRGS